MHFFTTFIITTLLLRQVFAGARALQSFLVSRNGTVGMTVCVEVYRAYGPQLGYKWYGVLIHHPAISFSHSRKYCSCLYKKDLHTSKGCSCTAISASQTFNSRSVGDEDVVGTC